MAAVPAWRNRRSFDPLEAIFEGHCCWPGCSKSAGDDIDVPMCLEHLLRAWRIVQNSRPWLFESDTPAVPPEPAPRSGVDTPGLVYFLRFGDRIKIGFTTNLAERLKAIPHDELLHTEAGTMREEKRCHAAFGHLRETGEWFRAEPDLLAFIIDLRDRGLADQTAGV